MSRVATIWEDIRSSLWFVPSLVVAGCVVLAAVLVEVDGMVGRAVLAHFPRLFGAGAEGTRTMLSAIGSAMINIAGVTFSVTIVALSLTSSQYSPRVLRNFMRDRANQLVLGAFLGIYAYCLVVVRTVRAGEDPFIPSIASFTAIVLALVGVGLLIHFIHHISSSMQAAQILKSIHHETAAAIQRLYPERIGDEEDASAVHADALARMRWTPVPAAASGYLTAADGDALIRVACEHDCVIWLEKEIGDFVIEDHPLAYMSLPGEAKAAERVGKALAIGAQRNIAQDAAFGIRQIVDIAEKALSPAVNDPTTAVMCIDRLAAILSLLAGRRIPSPYRQADGHLRVIAPSPDFAGFLDRAVDDILRIVDNASPVREHLRRALETVATQASNAARREALSRKARAAATGAVAATSVP